MLRVSVLLVVSGRSLLQPASSRVPPQSHSVHLGWRAPRASAAAQRRGRHSEDRQRAVERHTDARCSECSWLGDACLCPPGGTSSVRWFDLMPDWRRSQSHTRRRPAGERERDERATTRGEANPAGEENVSEGPCHRSVVCVGVVSDCEALDRTRRRASDVIHLTVGLAPHSFQSSSWQLTFNSSRSHA
jgi:hypothetical protein